ncbi:MAG: hypothetical protein CSA29_03705 [Desulfobacterales bacterium]|nr:MAG: hypothetical protein CSA29_03705 [Desulfobacterales bacterium]
MEITGWKGGVFVIGLVVFAFWMHDFIYYNNPKLDETIMALKSDEPAVISQALFENESLGMARGHKLIPYILPLLGDERRVPEEIAQKMIKTIQSTPGAISDMDNHLQRIMTIGFTAAMTIQSMIIIDNVNHAGWIRAKAKKRIISYVTEVIDPDDEYTISNGLAAVRHIPSKKLLPFWFQCLAIESEPIRIHAMSGLNFYIYDRTHGLWTWKPEKEISPSMLENLKLCLDDPYPHIRQEAEALIGKLKKAGFPIVDKY